MAKLQTKADEVCALHASIAQMQEELKKKKEELLDELLAQPDRRIECGDKLIYIQVVKDWSAEFTKTALKNIEKNNEEIKEIKKREKAKLVAKGIEPKVKEYKVCIK